MTDAQRQSTYSGMVDYFSEANDYYITDGRGNMIPNDVSNRNQMEDLPYGPCMDTVGFGGVLRVI